MAQIFTFFETYPFLWGVAGFLLGIILLILRSHNVNRDHETQEALVELQRAQIELAGGIRQVADTQLNAQVQLVDSLDRRFTQSQKLLYEQLTQTQRFMHESLDKSGKQTAVQLGSLMERLKTIDRAQSNIEKLSGDVLGLQDLLSNKQTRGNFGEIQLYDIVAQTLPPDRYAKQVTLSNGMRPDLLVYLPNPPGSIAIDSKFPLEAYEDLRRAASDLERKAAQSRFRRDVRKHIQDIAEKYIIEGETGEGAIMFLPSEAVYAELHANFQELVREGFALRVWVVSPTTCMATLTTMRAVMQDIRLREQAKSIRREVALLLKDMERLGARIGHLDGHLAQAVKDVSEIKISSEGISRHSLALGRLEFEEDPSPSSDAVEAVLPLGMNS